MITVVCSSKEVVRRVRDLFGRYGVDFMRVHELAPLDDPTIYLIINYTHGKEAQIGDEVRQKIPGARVQ